MKGPSRIYSAHQPVVVLGGQQNEFALASPGDFDRASESSLDDLAGSVTQVG
jgi:PHD/YefM family antitoxin component YafN of YafNO toxin-antitoxin module